jgi:4-hydroxybenzoate polyprenyltransferase
VDTCVIKKILARLKQYALLLRLHKPIGIYLLLWPTLWALWLAQGGMPNLKILLIFIAGTILMRSAGVAINDFADRRFDGLVKRTQFRPLAAKTISVLEVWILFFMIILLALLLVLNLNLKTICLSFVAVFLAILYPFTKRFFPIPQFFLGLAYAMGVPMAFTAITNQLPLIACLLTLAAILWPLAYDTYYAMVDRDDDLQLRIHSAAMTFGRADRLVIIVLQAVVLGLLVTVGKMLSLNYWYYAGLLAAAGFAIYQWQITKHRDRDACFKAFLNNNWFGLVIFLGIVANYF